MQFVDRRDAGRQLAERLRSRQLQAPVVLALPRGGVPVGFEIAMALGAPLDVFVARKVGAPGHEEWGIGAVAEGGGTVWHDYALQALRLPPETLDELVARERRELERRVRHYRGGRPVADVRGRDAILVDDGLATGVTAEAALRGLRSLGPRRLLLAVPVCAPDTAERLAEVAEEVVCLHAPPEFMAVGMWYEDFAQTSDEEVLDLLERTAATPGR